MAPEAEAKGLAARAQARAAAAGKDADFHAKDVALADPGDKAAVAKVASRMELIPQSAVSVAPSEEREAALTLESRERRQLIVEAGHCSLMPYSSRSRDRRRKRVRHRWLLWGGGASQARALCLPRFRCPQRKQVLAGRLDRSAPPPKFGAAPGYGSCVTGFLPPLGQEGAQRLPAAPESARAIAAACHSGHALLPRALAVQTWWSPVIADIATASLIFRAQACCRNLHKPVSEFSLNNWLLETPWEQPPMWGLGLPDRTGPSAEMLSKQAASGQRRGRPGRGSAAADRPGRSSFTAGKTK